MNYTKGPWTIEDNERVMVCTTNCTLWLLAEDDAEIASKQNQDDQDRINFRLLAAAPDMYEALKEAYNRTEDFGLMYLIEKALEKAEGRNE